MQAPFIRNLAVCAALVLATGILAGCDGDSTGTKEPPPPPPAAAAVTAHGGGGQQQTVGQPLAQPLVARVTDAAGNPVQGVAVQWSAQSGGGTVDPASSQTDAEGLAQARWTLGGAAGPQTAAAVVQGVAQPATFQAAASAGPAARIAIRGDSVVIPALWTEVRAVVDRVDAYGNVVEAGVPGPSWTVLDRDLYLYGGTDGVVFATRRGRSRMIAVVGELADTAAVVVHQTPAYVVSRKRLLLRVGESLQAYAIDTAGRSIYEPAWMSTNPAVATVSRDADGLYGVVVARGVGSASIVAIDAGTAGVTVEVVAPTPLTALTVAAGSNFACARTAGSEAYCWGSNGGEQLGRLTESSLAEPGQVGGPARWDTVVTGGSHGCALSGPAAYCWGDGSYGQLGTQGSRSGPGQPFAVAGGHAFRSISAGGVHSCGVTVAGEALCWGNNVYHQTGTGRPSGFAAAVSLPTPVQGGLRWAMLSAGTYHTCGVATDGATYCWGRNADGRLGVAAGADSLVAAPAPVATAQAFRSVDAGGRHTCALTAGGAAYCWGANDAGQLGSGGGGAATPTPVAGGLTFATLSAGETHTCGVTTAGQAYCWGANASGQLGDGTTTASPTPRLVAGGYAWRTVSAGVYSPLTCGVTTTGATFCWGMNDKWQLGNPIVGERSSVPVPVLAPLP
jgi:alpha-tubulin suppressor-like RCC1 family protein